MAYITIDYYKSDYLGIDPADDTELKRYITRASDYIDLLTDQAIDDPDDLTTAQQKAVKKATAAITEYFVENPDIMNISGGGSESIGSWSSSGAVSSSGKIKTIGKIGMQWLKSSGLIDRTCRKTLSVYYDPYIQ